MAGSPRGVGASAAGGGPSLPVGRVLALLGAGGLIAAYFMPWFGTQGIILTGSFLADFLGSTRDLRQFLPGSSGGAGEVQLLRALVYFFPAAGGLAAILALGGILIPRLRGASAVLLALLGAVVLVAVVAGQTVLPAQASREVGLWTIGLGALAVLLGGALDIWFARRPNPPARDRADANDIYRPPRPVP